MIKIGTPFNNSLKLILKKLVKYCFDENRRIDNTTTYVKSNICQTTHFTVKQGTFWNKWFSSKPKKRILRFWFFFKIDFKILSNKESKNITSSVFPKPDIKFVCFFLIIYNFLINLEKRQSIILSKSSFQGSLEIHQKNYPEQVLRKFVDENHHMDTTNAYK